MSKKQKIGRTSDIPTPAIETNINQNMALISRLPPLQAALETLLQQPAGRDEAPLRAQQQRQKAAPKPKPGTGTGSAVGRWSEQHLNRTNIAKKALENSMLKVAQRNQIRGVKKRKENKLEA